MSLIQFNLTEDRVISTDKSTVSTWTNNINNLTTAFTSSTQGVFTSPTSSGQFYINVFQVESTDTNAEVQYAVAYGNRLGSGSPDFTHDTGSFGRNAARATYGQYRSLVFGDEAQNFVFGNHTPEDIYVINVNRARYRQGLKPGSLNLKVSSSLAGQGTGGTSAFDIELTDDSVTKNGAARQTNIGRQFNIVSGTNGIASGSTELQIANSASYGHFYPDAGLIILNGDAFGVGLKPDRNPPSTDNADKNPLKIHKSISASGHFIVDSEEKVTSQYYFVRAKSMHFNYTTNPSFADNQGNLTFNSMINNPTTYITTVGLYNANNDLVAVAKLSQPIVKDFTKEALIRVKLDY